MLKIVLILVKYSPKSQPPVEAEVELREKLFHGPIQLTETSRIYGPLRLCLCTEDQEA